jgi:hypothetical protein
VTLFSSIGLESMCSNVGKGRSIKVARAKVRYDKGKAFLNTMQPRIRYHPGFGVAAGPALDAGARGSR